MTVNHKQNLRVLFTGVNSGVLSEATHLKWLSSISETMGLKICSSVEERPDLLICVDYHPRYSAVIREASQLGIPRVLIKQEPDVVFPWHANPKLDKRFSIVINRGHSDNTPIFNSYVNWDTSHIQNSNRKNRVVAITADKWSFVPGELYSLRREAYSKNDLVDVYGYGWDATKAEQISRLIKEASISVIYGFRPTLKNLAFAFDDPLNYLGQTSDKLRTLSAYKASLVIENDESKMSEKLLDCILTGTIPVYVGPPPEKFMIPSGLVVKADHSLRGITAGIDIAMGIDSDEYRGKAQNWLEKSDTKEAWAAEIVGKKILTEIISSLSL